VGHCGALKPTVRPPCTATRGQCCSFSTLVECTFTSFICQQQQQHCTDRSRGLADAPLPVPLCFCAGLATPCVVSSSVHADRTVCPRLNCSCVHSTHRLPLPVRAGVPASVGDPAPPLAVVDHPTGREALPAMSCRIRSASRWRQASALLDRFPLHTVGQTCTAPWRSLSHWWCLPAPHPCPCLTMAADPAAMPLVS
jgi:hypothetical protein